MSITVDSAADDLLGDAQKPFRRRHLDSLVALLSEHEVSADLGLIFGLPARPRTIGETIAFVAALPPSIEAAHSAGARVYPHTPLSLIARREPERPVGADDPSFLEPVAYSRPWPPRELARRLDSELSGLPNVSRVGVAYSGQTTPRRCLPRSPGLSDLQHSVTKSNGSGEVRDPRASPPWTTRSASRRDDCRLHAALNGRYDLASAGAARPAGRDPTRNVESAAASRPPRLRRLALADRAKSALRR